MTGVQTCALPISASNTSPLLSNSEKYFFSLIISLSRFFSILAVGLLAGCGAAPKATEDGEAAAPETLKVALILSGPANDQGWNATALEGLNEAEKEYDVSISTMENVSIADSEAAFRDYAAQGYNLIIGHGYQFGEPAKKVSGDFSKAFFMSIESNSESENMASYVMTTDRKSVV